MHCVVGWLPEGLELGVEHWTWVSVRGWGSGVMSLGRKVFVDNGAKQRSIDGEG